MTAELEDLAGEVWRDITGFEELYQVSNRGRVKSLGREETHKPGRGRVAKRSIRRASLSKTGYLQPTQRTQPEASRSALPSGAIIRRCITH